MNVLNKGRCSRCIASEIKPILKNNKIYRYRFCNKYQKIGDKKVPMYVWVLLKFKIELQTEQLFFLCIEFFLGYCATFK